jgi:hypothetical protein
MLDALYTKRYQLSGGVNVIVREYADHPARSNSNIKNVFCADGWWRIECWIPVNGSPTIFATVLMIRAFDEKLHNKFRTVSDRLFLLYIPIEGYLQRVTVQERENALTVQFSPNETATLGYLGLKIPSF